MCSVGKSDDKFQWLAGERSRGRAGRQTLQHHPGGQSVYQHGVRAAVVRGWNPHHRPLPQSVLASQDPAAPPPLCHLHRCHGVQRLSPSCGVRLSCGGVVWFCMEFIYKRVRIILSVDVDFSFMIEKKTTQFD